MAAVGEADRLPRRTAHALHALLEAERDLHMPPTAAEVCIYDSEALSPRATAAALTHGQRLGYCATISGIWTAGTRLHDIHGDLEDRYLRETMNEDLDG